MNNMKKILAVAILMTSVSAVQAQDVISKFFTKYQNDESFTNVNISSKMFGLFTQMDADNPEDKEILEAISKLKGLKILAKENARNSRDLYQEALSLIPKNFEELMSVRILSRQKKKSSRPSHSSSRSQKSASAPSRRRTSSPNSSPNIRTMNRSPT